MVIADNLAFTMLSFWNLHDKHLFLCPMKRRRYIAWVLMLVSIIMLTASVLPHHHHREILYTNVNRGIYTRVFTF